MVGLQRSARALGIGVVVAGAAVTWWAATSGAFLLAIVLGLAVAAWALVPLVGGVRHFRSEADIEIAAPAAQVFEFLADPVRTGRLEAPGLYDEHLTEAGVVAVDGVESTPAGVRYRQTVQLRAGRTYRAEVESRVDREAGTVRNHTTQNQGQGDVFRVEPTSNGCRVHYTTEVGFDYLTALSGVWLAQAGDYGRQAAARRRRFLERLKRQLESALV